MKGHLVAIAVAIPVLVYAESRPAGLRFVDATQEAGIAFTHEQGASGRRYMVEIAGAGVLVLDYDGDRLPDLYFVNGAPLPGDKDAPTPNALYRNMGGGRFLDVTESAGLQSRGYGMGGSAADVDNDGDVDLLVTAFGENLFFRNNGDGSFREADVGIGDGRWGTSATFFEANGDGFVDLYVTNYLRFTIETHRECVSPHRGIPSYCHQQEYDGVEDLLYINRGDGSFEDRTAMSGIDASN